MAATRTESGRLLNLPAPEWAARSSADEAASYIRRLIFQGNLKGGMRIPQDDIAAALKRSRVPVREALIALEREGWVTTVANRGAYVAALTPGSIRDHYELIGFAYGLAARRAVDRGSRDLAARLGEIGAGLEVVEDIDEFYRAVIAFHAAIVDAAESPRIRSALRSMTAFVPGNFFAQVPGSASVEQRSTTLIRRAIARGDGEKAADEYRKMLHKNADMVVNLLEQRGFFTSEPSAD